VSVVVVDDEPDVRWLLRFHLESGGARVVGEAADGDAAVAAVERLHPDAVVLDGSMPGVDGFAALSRIRAVDPACRVVVFSSLGPDAAARALELGAHAFVDKASGGFGTVVEVVLGR
jgi:CheY-like chemotaxis protein